MVAVGLEWFGLEEFLELGQEQWSGELFIDDDRHLYKHAGTGTGGVMDLFGRNVLGSIFSKKSYKGGKEIGGNLAGDGWPLGGTFVLDSEGNAVYSHLQKTFGDHAPIEEILSAVEGLETGESTAAE